MKQPEHLDYYDHEAVSLSKRYERAEMSFLKQMLTDHFRGVRKVLEIGTGSGRDAAFLVREGYDVTGIDG
jgi:protein-L-isoaspartate O-methyltransferase